MLYVRSKILQNGNLYSYLEESSMEILCWRYIIDTLWSISAGLNVIHELGLVHGHLHGGNILVENEMDSVDAKIADTGLHGPVRPSVISGAPPVFARLMLQCLDANLTNRPTISQLYECLGNWVSAIDEQSELSNQFDVAERNRISNLGKKLNIFPCHENAFILAVR